MQATEEYTKSLLTIREGDAFVDVGASVGGWSLWASKKVGKTGIVLALEPNPLAYMWLVKNTSGVSNIFPLNVAAHSSTTVIELWTVNNSMSSTAEKEVIGKYTPGMSKGHLNPTRAIRLDSLASRLRPAQSVVLKVDVEGAEVAALHGATGLIDKIQTVVVEVHNEFLQQEVVQFLVEHSFSVGLLSARGFFPNHVIGRRLEVNREIEAVANPRNRIPRLA